MTPSIRPERRPSNYDGSRSSPQSADGGRDEPRLRNSINSDLTVTAPDHTPGVHVQPDGPYLVRDTPLVRRREVLSENGEPMTWQTVEQVDTRAAYALCRCGARRTNRSVTAPTPATASTAPKSPPPSPTRPGPAACRAPGSWCAMTARSARTPGSAATNRPTCGKWSAVRALRTASPACS